jgi:hypothetical protein
MPKHSEGARKAQGHKRESAAESRAHAKKKGRKTRRATESSRVALERYEEKLKRGESVGAMFLAEVTSAPGGGHFHVQDVTSKERVMAHLTPALSMKRAKYGNSGVSFHIATGSHVLVDGNIIRAVVPRNKLSALKEEEENSNTNTIFSHSSRGSTRRNRR